MKAELTAEKEAAAASLSEKKAVFEGATGDFNARKAGCIGLESANAAGKGDVLLIMDDIAKLDKVGTALLRDKKEGSRFIPKNSQQLNRNRTCAENRNNWPTIDQQKNQHSHGPEEKNNISMKRKNRQHLAQKNGTCFIHLHRNTVPYCKK